ncbi:MAG TPA: metallophosphoesterase [Solirubrobacteraceae bacterium]
MSDPRFVRVHDRHLSLWQSAVAEHVRAQLGGAPAALEVLAHPLTVAANEHVEAVMADGRAAALAPVAGDSDRTAAYLSQLALEIAMAQVDGDAERAAALEIELRKYSDDDPGFLSCVTTYRKYFAEYSGVFKYNDWTTAGGNNPEYGVIEWELPNDAVVGIIGDWGTGLDDAKALLMDLMVKRKPNALIHLGDIYYSATPKECEAHYAAIITEVFDATLGEGNRIPVFTMAGNHDYYSLGYGFYGMFTAINHGIPGAAQPASYFCLRSEDRGWQFLAMDTGYYDADPFDQVNPLYAGPWLHPTEVQWLQHKLNTFAGATVLLSHHQLFSAHAKINGMASPYRDLPYLNPYLREAFAPYLSSDIAAWLWGHEHNLALYRNGIFGLAKGRLIGCSAYEELLTSEPYKVNYPDVPYLDPSKYQLGAAEGYYNHGYAIVELANRARPTDPVSITYYQYPSWGAHVPAKRESEPIFTELLEHPAPPVPQIVSYGAPIHLLAQEGLYIGPLYASIEYYPTASVDSPATLTIEGGSGAIRHGDQVQIKTTEAAAGARDVLGAWSTPTLYYSTPGAAGQLWTIRKRDPSNPEVHYGDEVCFVNNAHAGQFLQPYWSVLWGAVYLTTRSGQPYYWSA